MQSYSEQICACFFFFECNCSSLQYTAFYCLSCQASGFVFFALILGCLVSSPDYAYPAFIMYDFIDGGIDSHQSVKFIKSDAAAPLEMCLTGVQQMAQLATDSRMCG